MDLENKLNPAVSRRGFVGAAAAGAAALGLAACGNTGSDTKGSAAGSSSSSVEEIVADKDGFVVKAEKTDGKAPKNECVIALEGEIQNMHPMDWSDGNSGNVVYYIYDSLYDARRELQAHPEAPPSPMRFPRTPAPTPSIFMRASLSRMARRSMQTLSSPTIRSASRRRTVGAAAACSSSPSMTTPKRPASTTCTRLTTITLKVAFHLPKPYAPFMNSITQFYIINPKVVTDPDYDYGKKSAGSGPYVLEEYAKGDHCSLVKNDKYWGGQKDEGEVTIDRVDFKIIPEAGSRIAALQTGEATVIYPMPTDQVATVRSAGDINMVSMPSTTMRYVTLNTNVKELSDVRVRQAMNYAFNQDEYVKVMYAGAATPATSVLPALVPGYKEQEPFAYDLDKAKSLLKEAGYEDGFEVEIIGDNSTQETKGMTFVMQQLKKVGIEVKVVPNEAATNAEIAAEPEDTTKIQMWYVNWSQSDADGFMRSLLSTAMTPPTGYNTAFWKNEEFDNELQLGNEGKTEDEQNQHYGKCQDIVWPECPWLYLASDNTLMSYKAYLTGIKYVAQGIDVTHAKLNA